MIDCERWDVVTALFPFTDAAARKPRPVLVLSRENFNRRHGHVIGCMITTGAGSRWPSDHAIADLGATGLSHPSLVRWKVFTLPGALLGRRIGTLGDVDRAGITAQMATILGTPDRTD
jgi:mRNA interferase MazF